MFVLMIGFMRAFGYLFYFVSFHWVFRMIIRYKSGYTVRQQISEGLKNLMENNEEMSNAIIDS